MDITKLDMEYPPGDPVYSFLSTAWAIIADIDINSEAVRCCGDARFTLWGIYRALWTKRYAAKSFDYNGFKLKNKADWPRILNEIEDAENEPLVEQDVSSLLNHVDLQNESMVHFVAVNTPWIGASYNFAPQSRINDGLNDIIYMPTARYGKCALISLLLDQDNGNYWGANGDIRAGLAVDYIKCDSWTIDP